MSRIITYVVAPGDHFRILALVFNTQVERLLKFQKTADGSIIAHEDQPEDMLLDEIVKIDGVEKCETSRYSIVITRGLLFDWTTILDQVLALVVKRATLTMKDDDIKDVPSLVFIPVESLDAWHTDVENQWTNWLQAGCGQTLPSPEAPAPAAPKKERLI